MRCPSAGAGASAARRVGAEARWPWGQGAGAQGAQGSWAPHSAARRVCIAGSALDPAGRVATGSGPARRASPRQGAALLLGRCRRLLWAAQLPALERDDRREGTGP